MTDYLEKFFKILLFIMLPTVVFSNIPNEKLAPVNLWIEKNKPTFFSELKMLVATNTFSTNRIGISKNIDWFQKKYAELGFKTEIIDQSSLNRGDHLFAYYPSANAGLNSQSINRILALCHLDTVFSPKDAFQALTEAQNTILGPGVIDDKGGCMVILYALSALKSADLINDKTPIIVALIGDEENAGIPTSKARRDLVKLAKRSDIILGFEFADDLQHVVADRRGWLQWRVKISTPGGHSSKLYSRYFGIGAINLGNNLLDSWRNLIQNDSRFKGITLNPAIVAGGTETSLTDSGSSSRGFANIIPTSFQAVGDLRSLGLPEQKQLLKTMQEVADQKIKSLCEAYDLKNCSISLEIDRSGEYPPFHSSKETHTQLMPLLSTVHQNFGLPIPKTYPAGVRGAADLNFVGNYTVCAIDSIGAVGQSAHESMKEILFKEKTIKSVQRAAYLIHAIMSQSNICQRH